MQKSMIAGLFNAVVIVGIGLVALYVVLQVVIPLIQRTAEQDKKFKQAEAMRKRDEEAEAHLRERAEAEVESELGTVENVLGEQPSQTPLFPPHEESR